MFKGIPDSELAPELLLREKWGERVVWTRFWQIVLPLEPVIPMMVKGLPLVFCRREIFLSWTLERILKYWRRMIERCFFTM